MKCHANVGALELSDEEQPRKWGPRRIARLGFLIGREREALEIAESLHSTPAAIRRQAARLGLRFGESRWPRLRTFEILAAQRGLSYERFVEQFLNIADKEPTLVMNILDMKG